jgi:hypothetical protein
MRALCKDIDVQNNGCAGGALVARYHVPQCRRAQSLTLPEIYGLGVDLVAAMLFSRRRSKVTAIADNGAQLLDV